MTQAIRETQGVVSHEDWYILDSMSKIRSFRFLNYLVKALRLQSLAATLNFLRLVLKVAHLTGQTQVVFVNLQGQPIHKAGDLSSLLKKLVTQLPFATDVKTNDHHNYHFVNAAGRHIQDSPLLFVREVQGQKGARLSISFFSFLRI